MTIPFYDYTAAPMKEKQM